MLVPNGQKRVVCGDVEKERPREREAVGRKGEAATAWQVEWQTLAGTGLGSARGAGRDGVAASIR